MCCAFCSSELATLTCNESEIVNPNLTIHGKPVRRGILGHQQMIYIPQDWSYLVISSPKGAVTIAEAKLTPEGIEEVAASLGEQEIHALKRALENPLWHLWRRFTEILRQRRRNSN